MRLEKWEHPEWADTPAVRTMAVTMFPYRVIYYLTDKEFVILAYAHSRRKPGYWKHRLDN